MADFVQLARCLFGKHHRNGRRARFEGGTLYSHCKGCGRRMRKGANGWELVQAEERPGK